MLKKPKRIESVYCEGEGKSAEMLAVLDEVLATGRVIDHRGRWLSVAPAALHSAAVVTLPSGVETLYVRLSRKPKPPRPWKSVAVARIKPLGGHEFRFLRPWRDDMTAPTLAALERAFPGKRDHDNVMAPAGVAVPITLDAVLSKAVDGTSPILMVKWHDLWHTAAIIRRPGRPAELPRNPRAGLNYPALAIT